MFLLLAKDLHFCISDHAETLIWFQQAPDASDLRDRRCFGFMPSHAYRYKNSMWMTFGADPRGDCFFRRPGNGALQ